MGDYLALVHPFPRDVLIDLDESDGKHVYTVCGKHVQLSVTGVVQSVYPPFDDEKILKRMRARKSSSLSKTYAGKTDAEIARMWRKHSEEASRLGRQMHELIHEALTTGKWPDVANLTNSPEDRLKADFALELQMAQRFVHEKILSRGCEIIRSEMRIFYQTPDYMPAAAQFVLPGSLDCLFRTADGRYGIVDWKRTPAIKLDNAFEYSDLEAFRAFAGDINLHHYSLQLCIYACILQDQYGLDVNPEELYIVALHPSAPNGDYQCVRAVDMTGVVRSEIFANFDLYRTRAAEHARIAEKNRRLYGTGESGK